MAGRLILTNTAAAQARLAYNASNYTDLTTGSTGNLTITPSGGTVTITGTLATTGSFAPSSLSVSGAVGAGGSTTAYNHKMHVKGRFVSLLADATTPSADWSIYTNTGSMIGNALFGEAELGGGTIYAVGHANNTSTTCGEFTGYRARGTLAAPTIVQAGDELIKYAGVAFLGDTFAQCGFMQIEADTGVTTGAAGRRGRIRFGVANDSGVIVDALLLDRTQLATFYGDVSIAGNARLAHTKYYEGTTDIGGVVDIIGLNASNRTEINLNSSFFVLRDPATSTTAGAISKYWRVQQGGIEYKIPMYAAS